MYDATYKMRWKHVTDHTTIRNPSFLQPWIGTLEIYVNILHGFLHLSPIYQQSYS
jgi:hypothetical protein